MFWNSRWWKTSLLMTGLLFLIMSGEALALPGCSVNVVGTKFGTYRPNLSAPGDSTGSIDVLCSAGLSYTLHLDPGGNPQGVFVPRRLRQTLGQGSLRYNLYRNKTHTEVWGDGTKTTFIQQGLGTGKTIQWIIYGRIPGRQNVPVGIYGDTVRVIVLW